MSDDTLTPEQPSEAEVAGFTGYVAGFMGGYSVEELIRGRAKTYKVAKNHIFKWDKQHQQQIAEDYAVMLAEIDRLRRVAEDRRQAIMDLNDRIRTGRWL